MARHTFGVARRPPFISVFSLVGLVLPSSVVADNTTDNTTSAFFSPLGDLDTPGPSPRQLLLGQQNFTRCCLQAVQDWRQGGEPDVTILSSRNPTVVFASADQLGTSGEQFPCGATYNGDDRGAPQVLISYDWCTSNCGGWQRSASSVLTQWVQPFVGFILPSVAFCLNIPRRMAFTLDLTSELFPHAGWGLRVDYWRMIDKFGFWTTLAFLTNLTLTTFQMILKSAIIKTGGVAVLGILNLVVWVSIVFSTATPMILSGLYEAAVDRQVLRYIEREVIAPKWRNNSRENDLSIENDLSELRLQVHLLYAVLMGNLQLTRSPKEANPGRDDNADLENRDGGYDTAWYDVKDMIENSLHDQSAFQYEVRRSRALLNLLLDSQTSFGDAIGAPVAFFLGSFLFSVFGNLGALGDNDTSQALAFGEWWMCIPHIAIVSGCLLADANPTTLRVIISALLDERTPAEDRERDDGESQVSADEAEQARDDGEPQGSANEDEQARDDGEPQSSANEDEQARDDREPQGSADEDEQASDGGEPQGSADENEQARNVRNNPLLRSVRKLGTFIYKPVYQQYQPVWMWERARSKRNWIKAVQSLPRYDIAVQSLQEYGSRHRDLTELGIIGWGALTFIASVLIGVPCALAFVTSYYTPTVGLSCRTLTFVLYFVFQAWLAALWLVDFRRPEQTPLYNARSGLPTVFFILVLLGFAGSLFTTIAGTLLQLIGVFRNCGCSVPTWAWRPGSGDFRFVISTNSAEMIRLAGLYWLSTGVASLALLMSFCYLGWWYQESVRQRFRHVVTVVTSYNPAPTRTTPGQPAGGTLETPSVIGRASSSPGDDKPGGQAIGGVEDQARPGGDET